VLNSPTNGAPSDLPKPSAGPARSTVATAAVNRNEAGTEPPSGVSVIGNDLTILGNKITIISKNKLRVDGEVRGDVHGKQVTISDGGSVSGQVCAEKIEVRGGVRGSIRALSVTLYETAKVNGDIMHQKLSISEGAEFDGNVRRVSDANSLMPVLEATAFERAHDSAAPESADDDLG
jgi:cytoskeletal protein CcmA (bactofilin family)